MNFSILVFLALAVPPIPAAPERLDALDFNNGAYLIEGGSSYGGGVASWASWHLTDGSEDSLWCSAQGQTSNLAFVWELDTTWRLDTLALSNKNAQEESYPGISAKTVEILVAGACMTTWPIRLVQEGDQVYGCYDGGSIWGTVTGRLVQATWFQPSGDTAMEGTVTFSLSSDGNELWGVYFNKDGSLAGERSGPRAPASQGPSCVPARKGQVEQALKRTGRVVLYGIRFDTGSDVPRPESQATLDELASALNADKGLHVQIEGRTDATASDAYNWTSRTGVPAASSPRS